MKTILVVANETLGGAPLIDRVREKAGGDARVIVCVPRTEPRHGNVIYDESVFDAAQVRIDLARQVLREEGVESVGEVGDPDPYTATMDAIREFRPDEIVISTYPAASSGWLRRDLVGRITDAAGVPVEHVVVDLDAGGLPFTVTLVVANRTANEPELLDALKRRDGAERHLFIFVVPQEGGQGLHAQQARARLAQVLDRARAQGILCAGMIGDPDPYTATMNALQFFHRVDDILISTLPATRSGWLRADLVERVRRATNKPVDHVEAASAAAAA